MSKSTTGAYGDFPDYYYKKGNLFGSYLIGHTATISRDTRREVEVVGGGFPVIHASAPRPITPINKATPLTPHYVLMAFVRTRLSPKAVRHILGALAGVRGVQLRDLSSGDPYDQLDRFVIGNLTKDEQLLVLRRLREATRHAKAEQARRAPRTATQRPGRAKRRKRRNSSYEPGMAKAPIETLRDTLRFGAGKCEMCGATASPQDRARCEAEPHLFLGHVYCAVHVEKLRLTLSPSGMPEKEVRGE